MKATLSWPVSAEKGENQSIKLYLYSPYSQVVNIVNIYSCTNEAGTVHFMLHGESLFCCSGTLYLQYINLSCVQ